MSKLQRPLTKILSLWARHEHRRRNERARRWRPCFSELNGAATEDSAIPGGMTVRSFCLRPSAGDLFPLTCLL